MAPKKQTILSSNILLAMASNLNNFKNKQAFKCLVLLENIKNRTFHEKECHSGKLQSN